MHTIELGYEEMLILRNAIHDRVSTILYEEKESFEYEYRALSRILDMLKLDLDQTTGETR